MTRLCMIYVHLRVLLYKQSQYQFLWNKLVFPVSKTKSLTSSIIAKTLASALREASARRSRSVSNCCFLNWRLHEGRGSLIVGQVRGYESEQADSICCKKCLCSLVQPVLLPALLELRVMMLSYLPCLLG